MKTFEINDLYDYQFQEGVPSGEEYSDFGFLKNIFPAHTILGKIMGSTNHSKGIELGDILGGKKVAKKPKPQVIAPKVPEKKDNTKKYMMIGGGVLLLVIIIVMIIMMRKK